MLQVTSRLVLALALLALGPAAFAQTPAVPIDDFEDGDLSEYDVVFSGGENGALSTTDQTPDGSNFALQFAVDADDYGGFAGFGRTVPDAPVDVTSLVDPYVTFDLEAAAPMTLEVNFQNAGDPFREIRNALVLDVTGGYNSYALPLATFFDTQPDLFSASELAAIVFTVINAAPDGSSDTAETVLRLDNVAIVEGISFMNAFTVADFDDGDFSEGNGFFYLAGGEGIMASPTSDTPDGSANAFNGTIDADDYGGFALFGRLVEGAPVDVSDASTLNFFLRANGPGILEVNLQTGTFPDQDESRETYRLSDTGGEYVPVSLPLDAFIQTTATPYDPAATTNVILTFVQLIGDEDSDTMEFEFAVDALGFGTSMLPVSSEPGADDAAGQALSVFPNPAVNAATVAFTLDAPTDVRVEAFDVLGRRVAVLAEGAAPAGETRAVLDVGSLPAGLYLIRLSAEGQTQTRTVVVTR